MGLYDLLKMKEAERNVSISFLLHNYHEILKNYDDSKIFIERNKSKFGCGDFISDTQYNVRQCYLPCFNYYWNNISGKEEMIFHLGNTEKEGHATAETINIDIFSGQLIWNYSEAVFDAYVQYREIGHDSKKISYTAAKGLLSKCKSFRSCTGHTLEEYASENFEIYLSPESQKIRSNILRMHNAIIDSNAPLPYSSNKSPYFDVVNNNQPAINLLSIYDYNRRCFFYIRRTTQGYRFLSIIDISNGFDIENFNAVPTEEEITNLFNDKINARVCDRLLSDIDVKMLKNTVTKRNNENRRFNKKYVDADCLFILLNDDGTGEFNRVTKPGDSMLFSELDTLSKHTYDQ